MVYTVGVPKEQNHVKVTPQLREVLDGCLLSDASLQRRGVYTTAHFRLEQSPRRRGWLHQVQNALQHFGIKTALGSSMRSSSVFLEGRVLPPREYNLLRSLNYAELVGEHQRWYPEGVKIVPRDIVLTPTILLHWFCGDGRGGDKKGTLGFCTDGFTNADVDFLVERLWLDFEVTSLRVPNHRGHPQVLIGRRDEAMKIRRILHPLIDLCCAYKLQHVRPLQTSGRGRRLSDRLKSEIKRAKGSYSMRVAAEQFGVSTSKVWSIWHNK